MNIEIFREYCLSKPGATEHLPFDDRTLVFKVGGKMFALCDLEEFTGANLKCDTEWAIELREQYDGVTPGYHMNKKHWNTLHLNRTVPSKTIQGIVHTSYTLVRK
mgnify:CR=1 FL=1